MRETLPGPTTAMPALTPRSDAARAQARKRKPRLGKLVLATIAPHRPTLILDPEHFALEQGIVADYEGTSHAAPGLPSGIAGLGGGFAVQRGELAGMGFAQVAVPASIIRSTPQGDRWIDYLVAGSPILDRCHIIEGEELGPDLKISRSTRSTQSSASDTDKRPAFIVRDGTISTGTPTLDEVTFKPKTLPSRVSVGLLDGIQLGGGREDNRLLDRLERQIEVEQRGALEWAVLLGSGVDPQPNGVWGSVPMANRLTNIAAATAWGVKAPYDLRRKVVDAHAADGGALLLPPDVYELYGQTAAFTGAGGEHPARMAGRAAERAGYRVRAAHREDRPLCQPLRGRDSGCVGEHGDCPQPV